jgi:enamine deaminase RidA (YjgF/YER057c/UK114 family)
VAASVIARRSSADTAFSVADWRGAREVFAVAAAPGGSTFERQAGEVLGLIDAAARSSGVQKWLVQQTVFLADIALVDRCRQIVRAFYGEDLPATVYLPQPPCNGGMLAVEAVALAPAVSDVELERHSERLVAARHDGIEWFFCSLGDCCLQTTEAYGGAADALKQVRAELRGAGADFDQVVRTWLYLGGIVAADGRAQRYKELNRARDEFYRDIDFRGQSASPRGAGVSPAREEGKRDARTTAGPNRTVYPASTCIGIDGRGLSAAALAVRSRRDDVTVTPLENPRQIAAYDYRAAYSPSAPRFSRAAAIRCGPQAMIFISGTASITSSETRHLHDAVAQAGETLDNIEALISEENLAGHGLPGFGARPADLAAVRVYVKRKADYAGIRAVCEKRLGQLPAVYLLADVCRPELLVEIEGIAFSSKAPSRTGGGGTTDGTRHIAFHSMHSLAAGHDPVFNVARASSP